MAENKRVILRMCVSCRQMKNRNGLLKVVKSPDGEIGLDTSLKLQGRGAYICKSLECLAAAEKRRSFERAFKGVVPPLLYETIRNEINGQD